PDEPIFVDNIKHDERLDERMRAILTQADIQAFTILPLALSNRWVGLITINWITPYTFTPGDLLLYRSLATQAAIVVDNRTLFAKTQAALSESKQMYEASRRLAAAADLQEVLATIVESVPIPTMNRAVLLTYEYDVQGNFLSAVVAANWHSGQGTTPT